MRRRTRVKRTNVRPQRLRQVGAFSTTGSATAWALLRSRFMCSGLSRRTYATAKSLARVLGYMYRQGVMPEFMASLPMTGVDGTMRRRPLAAGSAHVKTGFLQDVRSLAGYVTDVEGRRWSIVMLINDAAPADRDRAFARTLLEWVASGRGDAVRAGGN